MRGRRERGGALAGVLIGLAVLAALAIAAVVAGTVYFAHNVRVHETENRRGKTVHVETPVGSIQVREGARLSASDLGVALYPGAAPLGDGAKVVNLDLSFLGAEQRQLGVLAAEFTTPDDPDRVINFYLKECPAWSYHSRRDGAVEIETNDGGKKRVVAIRRSGHGSRITIAQVGAPAVN